MKPLELTEKQKEKLLEMCEKLFPQFYEVVFNIDFLKLEGNSEEDNPNLLLFFEKGKNAVEIHWFELCLKEILDTLAFKQANNDLVAEELYISFYKKALYEIFLQHKHPVDYLYEQFKKLTK